MALATGFSLLIYSNIRYCNKGADDNKLHKNKKLCMKKYLYVRSSDCHSMHQDYYEWVMPIISTNTTVFLAIRFGHLQTFTCTGQNWVLVYVHAEALYSLLQNLRHWVKLILLLFTADPRCHSLLSIDPAKILGKADGKQCLFDFFYQES